MQNEAEILLKKMQEFQEQELADLGCTILIRILSQKATPEGPHEERFGLIWPGLGWNCAS